MLFVYFLLFNFQDITNNQLTPKEYFGDSYIEASEYFVAKQKSFKSHFRQYGIDYKIATAIVFPEVIRFNRFRDFAETTALELAYVQGGPSVADFSIGRFQMKPSFVEMLEQEIKQSEKLTISFSNIITFNDTSSIQTIRRERISRLKDEKWQTIYLTCFIQLAKKRFQNKIEQNPNEELLILSSAYNLSLLANYDDFKRVSKLKTFPYGRLGSGRFSYYDVALYYYRSISE